MHFTRFQVLPTVAKFIYVQEKLVDMGYDNISVNGKRDKLTVKAIMDVQKRNGIIPNGVICERTFNVING
jgi:hypothetical protein